MNKLVCMNVCMCACVHVCESYVICLSNGIVLVAALVVVVLAIVGEMLEWQRACYHFRSVRGIKVCSLITTYRTALSDITCTQMYSCCSRERAQTTESENYLFIRYIDDMVVVAGGNMVLKIATMMIRRLGDCELFKRFPLEIRVSLLLGKS